jgi:hydrogenase small subunit
MTASKSASEIDILGLFHRAAKGQLAPYILVVEGYIPDEKNKTEGYWASLGTGRETGQPILTCAMEGNPTGAMGLPDCLGSNRKSQSGIPIVCVPGWRRR